LILERPVTVEKSFGKSVDHANLGKREEGLRRYVDSGEKRRFSERCTRTRSLFSPKALFLDWRGAGWSYIQKKHEDGPLMEEGPVT